MQLLFSPDMHQLRFPLPNECINYMTIGMKCVTLYIMSKVININSAQVKRAKATGLQMSA